MSATIARPGKAPPSSAARLWRRTARLRFLLGFLAVLVLAWEVAVAWSGVRPYIFPSPGLVVRELLTEPEWIFQHAQYTLGATLIGFGLSVAIGLLLAIGIVYSRLLDQTLFAALVTSNAIPKVAIAPLFILWIGTGLESKVLIAVLVSIFPMVVDSVVGLRSVDPGMLDLARTYRGSRLQMFWKIQLPNALPSVFAGMKVAISLALVGTIVGEFVGSNWGLGYVIMQAQGTYNTARAFAAILVLVVIGTVLYQLVDLAERKAMPWHVSHRHAED